jgi:hypothetical protein
MSGGQISYEEAVGSLAAMFPKLDRSVLEMVRGSRARCPLFGRVSPRAPARRAPSAGWAAEGARPSRCPSQLSSALAPGPPVRRTALPRARRAAQHCSALWPCAALARIHAVPAPLLQRALVAAHRLRPRPAPRSQVLETNGGAMEPTIEQLLIMEGDPS